MKISSNTISHILMLRVTMRRIIIRNLNLNPDLQAVLITRRRKSSERKNKNKIWIKSLKKIEIWNYSTFLQFWKWVIIKVMVTIWKKKVRSKTMRFFHKRTDMERRKERKKNRKDPEKEARQAIQIDYELKHLSLDFNHLRKGSGKRIKNLDDIPWTFNPHHSISIFFDVIEFVIFIGFYLFFAHI